MYDTGTPDYLHFTQLHFTSFTSLLFIHFTPSLHSFSSLHFTLLYFTSFTSLFFVRCALEEGAGGAAAGGGQQRARQSPHRGKVLTLLPLGTQWAGLLSAPLPIGVPLPFQPRTGQHGGHLPTQTA
eukprot:jgi/Botrbrau1/14066/Bobra.182_3s0013.1